MSLNHVALQGRFVRDPELKATQNGIPVVSFCIAVDRDFKDKQTGERATDFINVTAWRQTAELVARSFRKGSGIVVDGRIQTRKYTDKQGAERIAFEVLANNVYFTDKKRDSSVSSGGAHYGGAAQDVEFTELKEDDGELPF